MSRRIQESPEAAREAALGRLRASPSWPELKAIILARAKAGFSKKPRGSPTVRGGVKVVFTLAGHRDDVHFHPDSFQSYDGSRDRILRALLVHPAMNSQGRNSGGLAALAYGEAQHLNPHGPDQSWWLQPLVDEAFAEIGEERLDVLGLEVWAAFEAGSKLVAGKVEAHHHGVARRRLKKAIKAALEDGLTHDDVVEVLNAAVVASVMDR